MSLGFSQREKLCSCLPSMKCRALSCPSFPSSPPVATSTLSCWHWHCNCLALSLKEALLSFLIRSLGPKQTKQFGRTRFSRRLEFPLCSPLGIGLWSSFFLSESQVLLCPAWAAELHWGGDELVATSPRTQQWFVVFWVVRAVRIHPRRLIWFLNSKKS